MVSLRAFAVPVPEGIGRKQKRVALASTCWKGCWGHSFSTVKARYVERTAKKPSHVHNFGLSEWPSPERNTGRRGFFQGLSHNAPTASAVCRGSPGRGARMGLLRVGLCQLFHCDRESQYLLSTRRSPRTFLQIRLAMAWARRDQISFRQNLAPAECRGFCFVPICAAPDGVKLQWQIGHPLSEAAFVQAASSYRHCL